MPMSNTLISLLFLLSFAELCTELCTRCFSYDAHSVLFHVFFFPRYSSTSEFLESVLLFCDHGLDFGSGKHLPNEGTHKSLANKKSGKNLAKLINQFSNVSTIMYTRYTRAWPLLAKNICIRAGSTDRRNLDSSNVCTLVFSSCFFLVAGTKFGRVVLHYKTKKRLFFFFLHFVRCILRFNLVVCWYCNEEKSSQISFHNSKKQGAKKVISRKDFFFS